MEGRYEEIIEDVKRIRIGFGFDKDIEFKTSDELKEILKKVGITEGSVTVWGTGEVYREFLHVDDLAEACVYLMENIDAEEMRKISSDYFVNVGTGKDLKIKELVEIIKDVVEYKGNVIWDTSKPDGTPRKLLDISKIVQLGWKPKIELEEGIKRTYESYLKGLVKA